jgi:hypothetical protein
MQEFWKALISLRTAMMHGAIDPIARQARAMLETLPETLGELVMRSVAVEWLDVIHRLLTVLPYPLVLERPRTDALLRQLLSPGQQAAILFTQPQMHSAQLGPNPNAEVVGWAANTIFLRYCTASFLEDEGMLQASRQAWSFVPHVEAGYRALDQPGTQWEAQLLLSRLSIHGRSGQDQANCG